MAIRKILIVDDSPTERHVLNDMLTKAGFEVVASDNGEDAIHKSKHLKPDLILMDVVMPGLDGIEATKLIRKDQPECRVVLVSGSIFVDRRDEGLEAARAAGASAYVIKSRAALDLAEVVVAVARSTGNVSGSSA